MLCNIRRYYIIIIESSAKTTPNSVKFVKIDDMPFRVICARKYYDNIDKIVLNILFKLSQLFLKYIIISTLPKSDYTCDISICIGSIFICYCYVKLKSRFSLKYNKKQ